MKPKVYIPEYDFPPIVSTVYTPNYDFPIVSTVYTPNYDSPPIVSTVYTPNSSLSPIECFGSWNCNKVSNFLRQTEIECINTIANRQINVKRKALTLESITR